MQRQGGEAKKLLAAAAAARDALTPEPARFAAAPAATVAKEPAPAPPLTVTADPYDTYTAFDVTPLTDTDDALFDKRRQPTILRELDTLLATEGPITKDRLTRRLAARFGTTRVTARVRERIDEILTLAAATCEPTHEVYWPRDQAPADYHRFRVPEDADPDTNRDIAEIPAVEIANAVRHVLRTQVALPHDALCRETARLLGFARLGSNVRDAVTTAIATLYAKGDAQRHEDRVTLP